MMTELDTTSIGVLTEREYRLRDTFAVVKADFSKAGMIEKWSNYKIEMRIEGHWYFYNTPEDRSTTLNINETKEDEYYILKDKYGHVWPLRADIFEKTYEEIL